MLKSTGKWRWGRRWLLVLDGIEVKGRIGVRRRSRL
jgi:hypothetical protein